MSHGDIRERHGSLFVPANFHRASKHASTSSEQSLPTSTWKSSASSSSSSTSTAAATSSTRPKRKATDILSSMFSAANSDDNDSDSSLNDLGSSSKTKAGPRTVQRATQPWIVPDITEKCKKVRKAKPSSSTAAASASSSSQLPYLSRGERTISIHRPSGSTSKHSSSSGKPATSKQGNGPSRSAYATATSTTSTAGIANGARKPKISATATSTLKGKERASEDVNRYTNSNIARHVTELDDSSSEAALEEPKKQKTIQTTKTSKQDPDRNHRREKDDVDVVPFQATAGSFHVDNFLFTPPEAGLPTADDQVPPISATSANSSKENRSLRGGTGKSSTSKSRTNATHESKKHEPRQEDINRKKKGKQKSRKYEYDEDYESGGNADAGGAVSDAVSASSTASLEKATQRATIDTSSPKPNYTPNTRRMVIADDALSSMSIIHTERNTSKGGRTPAVARGIKNGSSAAKKASTSIPAPAQTVRGPKVCPSAYLPSGNSGPARSSTSPAPKVLEQQQQQKRRAEPAVNGTRVPSDGTDGRKRAGSSSSAGQTHLPSRKPLADKQRGMSSAKNTKTGSKASATDKTYFDLASSPDKLMNGESRCSAEARRPITLSSRQHPGIDEDQEDSFEVAVSSTIRSPQAADGPSTRLPISSLALQEELWQSSRGKPTPVFKRPRNGLAGPDQKGLKRAKARPAASASKASGSVRPMPLDVLEHINRSTGRLSEADTFLREREAEIATSSSSPTKKRAATASRTAERQFKRRSTPKGKFPFVRVERSDSPLEQTQILWRRAALSDGFENADTDMESDSDDDVPVASYREIVLCPFCDRELPARPSRHFIRQLEKLCNRVDLRLRDSSMNSMALRLPVTDTALSCKRHIDESEVIPAGEAAGYPIPGNVDWNSIVQYIRDEVVDDLKKITVGKLQCSFLVEVRREWEEQGARKMGNTRNQYTSFYLELPGYYGQKGFEVIMRVLSEEIISKGFLTAAQIVPLDAETYARRVLVPETAVRLIQMREGCTRPKALEILQESRDYGAAVFGDSYNARSQFTETQIEHTIRVKEEVEAASQREDLLSSHSQEAEALRMGQAVIVKLKKMIE